MSQSDYERFIQTEALLSLQRDKLCEDHPEMISFIIVHQVTELCLKLALSDVFKTVSFLESDEVPSTVKTVKKLSRHIDRALEHLKVLEAMAPLHYHSMRHELGNGSGFSSPGWSRLRGEAITLKQAFELFLDRRELTINKIYQNPNMIEFNISESLVDFDVSCLSWRHRHLCLIERLIGSDAVGTAGTPINILKRLSDERLFPELWLRSRLGGVLDHE